MLYKNQWQFKEDITVRPDILNLWEENILETFPDIGIDCDV